MGYPMAGYISKGSPTVYNRTKAKAEKWARNTEAALILLWMPKDSDFIFTCVGNDNFRSHFR